MELLFYSAVGLLPLLPVALFVFERKNLKIDRNVSDQSVFFFLAIQKSVIIEIRKIFFEMYESIYFIQGRVLNANCILKNVIYRLSLLPKMISITFNVIYLIVFVFCRRRKNGSARSIISFQ